MILIMSQITWAIENMGYDVHKTLIFRREKEGVPCIF